MAAKGQEIVPVKDYQIMEMKPGELQELLRANVGPAGISEFDLERLKVPSGGGDHWMVPLLEGGTEPTKEIQGIVIYWKDVRAYWRVSYDKSGGGSPPDCSSNDGFTGYGIRNDDDEQGGHDCTACPLSRFGSEVKDNGDAGRGQACKQMRILFVLSPQMVLPRVIACPPTSYTPMKQFMLRLTSSMIPIESAVMGFKLEEDKNADGVAYSKVMPRMIERVDAKTAAKLKEMGALFRPLLEGVAAKVAQDREAASA